MLSPTRDLRGQRRSRLLMLLETAKRAGARFITLSGIDAYLLAGDPVWLLKHDVHGSSLESLLQFAQQERAIGVVASYFFMAPDHPLTRPHYTFRNQVAAMREIVSMGHHVGVHVDPYYLMHHYQASAHASMMLVLKQFADAGVSVRVGNLHGNSAFKRPDREGLSTAFDLFEELARQPDYPHLTNVPDDTAVIIRANRTSLAELELTHWADSSIWSARRGHVVTHYITDNRLEEDGSLQFLAYAEAPGQYPVTSSSDGWLATVIAQCKTTSRVRGAAFPPLRLGPVRLPLDEPECERWFSELGAPSTRIPVQILIHPQHC